jgi:hypothetical protein
MFHDSNGTRASSLSGMSVVLHQRGPLSAEEVQSWQSFGCLHSGQSSGAIAVLLRGELVDSRAFMEIAL